MLELEDYITTGVLMLIVIVVILVMRWGMVSVNDSTLSIKRHELEGMICYTAVSTESVSIDCVSKGND